jgi:hypothetical protein
MGFALSRGDPRTLPDSTEGKTRRLLEGGLAHSRSQEPQHRHRGRSGLDYFSNAATPP